MLKFLFIIIIIIIICCCILFVFNNTKYKSESFCDYKFQYNHINEIYLDNFFQFVEYYQLEKPIEIPSFEQSTQSRESERIRIKNSLEDILKLTKILVNSDDYKKQLVSLFNLPNSWDFEMNDRLPKNITLKDYYTDKDIDLNLLVLKKMINTNITGSNELIDKISQAMVKINNTQIYKEYLKDEKFDYKYAGDIFNPDMIRI